MTDDLPDLMAAAMVMRLPEWAISTPASWNAQGSSGGGWSGSNRVASTRATSFSGNGAATDSSGTTAFLPGLVVVHRGTALHALDAGTGTERWHVEVGADPRCTVYGSAQGAGALVDPLVCWNGPKAASPAVTVVRTDGSSTTRALPADVAWAAATADGGLVTLTQVFSQRTADAGDREEHLQIVLAELASMPSEDVEHAGEAGRASHRHPRDRDDALVAEQHRVRRHRPRVGVIVGDRQGRIGGEDLTAEPVTNRHGRQQVRLGLHQPGQGSHPEGVVDQVHPKRRIGAHQRPHRCQGRGLGVGGRLGRDEVAKDREQFDAVSG